MSKKQKEKRYIVTFNNESTTMNEAAGILNVAESKMLDAVDLLATEKMLEDADVLHYEGLGASSLTLSDTEVDKLRSNEMVLAVEEDLEMTIFEDEFDTDPFALIDENSISNQYYSEGYKAGIKDIHAKISELAKSLYNANVTAAGPIAPGPIAPPIALQPIPANINVVKAPKAWARGITGTNVKVAILDTGIAAHTDLIISGGVSFVPGVVSFHDGNSHGTHCAGIIGARNNTKGVVGVAPNCKLYAVKVLSDAGSGSTSWILAGMAWAKNNGMNVVSMSLGSNSCQTVAYTNAIAQLNAAGVTVVCASGNNGAVSAFPCVGSPANSPGCLAVGAVNNAGVIAPFSSRGNGCCPAGGNPVSLVAPGVSINSTIPTNTYGVKSGTSMACPHVAGAAALVKQRFPLFTSAQVRAKLMSKATDLGVPGNDPVYGRGLLNCDLATI